MNARDIARNLMLVRRNRMWLSAPRLPASTKLGYYPALVRSYLDLVRGAGKRVRYLGRPFHYDNPATPLNLQTYPYEVGARILGHMRIRPLSVLDIGANIGQFACTVAYLVPGCVVDSFEPNTEIVDLLERNIPPGVRAFRSAIGPADGPATLYFEPGRSAVGSLVRGNAGDGRRLREVGVRVESDVAAVTGRDDYDLVKVDVEGAECDVVAGLKGVRARYLYIEVSGEGREKTFTDARLYATIADTFGDFTVRYCSGFDERSVTYDLLLEFAT